MLSNNLKIDQYVNLKKYYSGNQLSLLLRKGVYDFMKKFDETRLPPKEAFYSKFTYEGITDEDYQHAQTVWKEFNIDSMKDNHNLYNLYDALEENINLNTKLRIEAKQSGNNFE